MGQADCPGCSEDPRTWRDAFEDRRPPIYREIVRRPVGDWEVVERAEGTENFVCDCGRVNPERNWGVDEPRCRRCGNPVPR